MATTSGNFDSVAPIYDLLAQLVFGHRLQQAQLVWLSQIPPQASILIVGGGTGWLLEQLLVQCKPQRVVYLDASARMVSKASCRITQKRLLGTVEYRTGDATALQAEERFDVVITPFLLDLFVEKTLQKRVLPRLKQTMQPTGLWLVTDFVETEVAWQRGLLWLMIRFFRLTANIETHRLANWQQLLAQSGLVRIHKQPQVWGMVSTEVWTC